ncbi:MAG: condensation domain-containing protein, partial [Longimicrobiales bacterium]
MNDLEQRIANLSPEKRRELEAQLLKRRVQQQEGVTRIQRDGTGPLQLSFGQLRLWFLDQLEPGSSAYNIPLVLRLTGALDVVALEGALSDIVARHEALRTKFASEDGEPVQVVVPAGPVALSPGQGGPADVDRDRVADLAREEARRPFDLTEAPPVRFKLLRLSQQEHWLVVTLHHIVADGWSLSVLQEELAAAYVARREGQESPAGELPVQYPDYAHWQRERADSDSTRKQLDYWRSRLADAPTLSLPTDRPRPEMQSYRGAMLHHVLPGELVEDLKALGRSHQATLYMVLLGALNVLFHRYSGQRDICIGSPIAGRSRQEFEGLIGMFVNNLVLRTDLSGDPTFAELLSRVRTTALEAFDHQDVPFEMLVEEIQPDRDLASSPLFQAMLVLQNQPAPPSQMGELEMERAFVDIGTTHLDLTFYLTEQATGLEVAVEYSTDLFDPSTIDRMVQQFATLLKGVVAAPKTKTSKLPLLPAEERERVLIEWNRTDQDYPNEPVQDLVASQA